MAETFNKKEREKKKEKRRKDKLSKKEARKENPTRGGLDQMMAYVDENGMLTDTPPDPNAKKAKINLSEIEVSIPKKEKEDIDPTMTGTISYYDSSKGYGFIKSGDESFFMHRNNVSGEPVEGKRVRFEKEKGTRGWTAVRVVLE